MDLANLSVTASSNTLTPPNGAPEGSFLYGDISDTFRQVMALIRRFAASDTIASATTCDIGTKDAAFLTVSGTTTITGLGTVSAGIYKFLTFSGALQLTHNATSLKLPGEANITTAAGDVALVLSEGSGNWKMHYFNRYAAGTSYQPLDADLTAIAALTTSAYGRSLLEAANEGALKALINAEAGVDFDAFAALASQAEAEAGTETAIRNFSPLRIAQAIAALGAGSVSVNTQTFTSSGTWTKPSGKVYALIKCWGGGGSGGKGASNAPAGGGGGGAFSERFMFVSDLGATETVTIGAGGAGQTTASTAGNAGGNTTFGAHLTAYGGGGGGYDADGGSGGGGGGSGSAGGTPTGGNNGIPYTPTVPMSAYDTPSYGGGAGGDSGGGGSYSMFGGGGGGGGLDAAGTGGNAGGQSTYGGGGGGGAANSSTPGAGGTSTFGGGGSAGAIDANDSSAGTQPGGGSGGTEGGNSGAGGAGKCVVYCW